MIRLLNEKMSFVFDGSDIIVGKSGKTDTSVSYCKHFKLYHVSYGTRGYPYLKIFKDADEVINFIKEIHY